MDKEFLLTRLRNETKNSERIHNSMQSSETSANNMKSENGIEIGEES